MLRAKLWASGILSRFEGAPAAADDAGAATRLEPDQDVLKVAGRIDL
jgi:hypothetical protein